MQITRRTALRACAFTMSTTLSTRTNGADVNNVAGSGIINDSVVSLCRRIRSREISSHEVVSAYLARIDQVNGQLNAVVRLRAEEALKEARECDAELAMGRIRGILHGIPFTVKDSFDTAGLVSTAGTTGRAKHLPKEDAIAVHRLSEAGAILLGKTNTPELTLAYSTINRIYGATLNPYDLAHSPGGSSGGAASILAASGSPLDICSDTAGSLRIPAHFCGVTCLKPTSGRVPRTGHIIDYRGPLQALTHVGPMARFVSDLRLVLPIIAGIDGIDPHVVPAPLQWPSVDTKRLRIAYFSNNGRSSPSQETKVTIDAAAEVVKPHVASLKSVFPSFLDAASRLYGQLVTADGMDWAKRILAATGTESSTLGILRKPMSTLTIPEFVRLVEKWDDIKSRSLEFWRNYDAMICPVSAAPAHKIGTPVPGLGSYVAGINIIGCPAVVVRAGANLNGLPIGVQVLAPMWREDRALAIAEIIEDELGGWKPLRGELISK